MSRVVFKPGSATREHHWNWRRGRKRKKRGRGGEGGERCSLPHGEVVLSGLPARLAQGRQPPGESIAARHPSAGGWLSPRSQGGVPTASSPGRGGGAGGERRSGARRGGSRGSTGGRGRAGGGGGFLAAGFAAELVVARDGAVAGQDLHLAEDGLVPEARLPWRGTGTASPRMKVALGSHPCTFPMVPKDVRCPLAG